MLAAGGHFRTVDSMHMQRIVTIMVYMIIVVFLFLVAGMEITEEQRKRAIFNARKVKQGKIKGKIRLRITLTL